MEIKTKDQCDNQSNLDEYKKSSKTISISDVFDGHKKEYLNIFTFFLSHFGIIPNCIELRGVDCTKASSWLLENLGEHINDSNFLKSSFDDRLEIKYSYYFLYDDLIVGFDHMFSNITLLFKKTEISKVEYVSNEVLKYLRTYTKRTPKISLLVNGRDGIFTSSMNISKPKLSIQDNYNDDFKDVHQTIIKRLSKKNDKGLVLLHGKPGTGKTSYVRYLISSIKKDVIFLPPNLADAITGPNFISILMSHINSVLVIEDAENIIMNRSNGGASPVSALLNICDGLLSDCLNIQVICSFNTDLSKIDNALLRKGRLIAKYEFKELETIKANALSKKLGFFINFDKPTTLTEIYNNKEKEFSQIKKNSEIGFNAVSSN